MYSDSVIYVSTKYYRRFSGADEESVDHLFVSCVYIFSIWYHIFRWLGIEFVSPNNIGHVF
jgi:hypothetical protein